MTKKHIRLPSSSGKHRIHLVIWKPDGEIKAILQISHGMVEYMERYDHFAKYMAKQGILVIGNDHLGHGHSALHDDELGYFCEKDMNVHLYKDARHEVLNEKMNNKVYDDIRRWIIFYLKGLQNPK